MSGQGSLGDRIRELRVKRQMSQAQLAWPELSDSYVSLIESGKRTPAPDVVRLLARKLECSPAYLTTGVTEAALSSLEETLSYAKLALNNGETEEARLRFAESLTNPAIADLPALAYEARVGHALALENAGRLDAALAELTMAANTITPLSDPVHWAEVHIAMCRCHRDSGALTEAIEVGEAALRRLTETGGSWTDEMVMLGATVLAAYVYRGDLAYATQLAVSLTGRAESVGTPRALMAAYWNAGWVASLRGDVHEALQLSERALALLGEENDPRNLCRLRVACARFLMLAEPERADHCLELLRKAEEEIAASAAGATDAAWCLVEQGRAQTLLGRPDKAMLVSERAIELLSGTETAGLPLAEAYVVLGNAYALVGRRQEGIDSFVRAGEHLESLHATLPAARVWSELAELLGAAGRKDDQRNAMRHALVCMGL